MGGGYFFTAIGLWTDSWYYWQDQMFMWMLLYAVINFLLYTDSKQLKKLFGATLCFAISANYWTLHNLLFIITVISLYIFSQKNISSYIDNKLKEIGRLIARNKFISLVTICCLGIWIVVLGSAFIEQYSNYSRYMENIDNVFVNNGYSIERVFNRAIGLSPAYLTFELFDPVIRETSGYNYIHYARYIGISLLPLLLLALYHKYEKTLFFLKLCIINLVICFVPGFLLPVWNKVFNFDQHYFYMYAHFLEISVLLFAAVSFEEYVDKGGNAILLKKTGIVVSIILVLGWLIDYNVERRFILAAVLLMLSVFALWMNEKYKGSFWLILFLLIYLADITRYYYESALGDYSYMDEVAHKAGEGNGMLRSTFELVENNTFEAGIAENSPPVFTHLWPTNKYLPSKSYSELKAYQEKDGFIDRVDYSFDDRQDLHFYKKLDEFDGQAVSTMEDRVEGEYLIEDYGYNDWTIQCNVQTDGVIVFNLMYDKLWDIYVDGEKVETQTVNINYLGINIAEGAHQITISYRPLARTIYPIAAFLLICTLVLLYIMIIMEDKYEGSNSRWRIWNKNK